MKKNIEIGDLYEYKYGGMYQLVIDVQEYDPPKNQKRIIVQQVGGLYNGLQTFYSEQSLRMRYNVVE